MSSSYSKPYLPVDQQIALMESRGMTFGDKGRARRYLETIGYYNLSGYSYPMRRYGGSGRSDDFVSGATFEHVLDLYHFDKVLRRLTIEALERLEQAVKVDLALRLGAADTFAHLHERHFDRSFVTPVRSGSTRPGVPPPKSHAIWVEEHAKKLNRNNSDFINHFRRNYGADLPIWVAIEVMDFNDVSWLVKGARQTYRIQMAQRFGVPDDGRLKSWVQTMRYLRNVCAHHGRLWNRSFDVQPRQVSDEEDPFFAGLNAQPSSWGRTYGALTILAHLNQVVAPDSKWALRVARHISTFPSGPNIQLGAMGVQPNWRSDPPWQITP